MPAGRSAGRFPAVVAGASVRGGFVASERAVVAGASSYAYKETVVVGAKLPTSGVTYYEVPQEYGVTKYRYTVVNERPVLVDPGTHTIVQVID